MPFSSPSEAGPQPPDAAAVDAAARRLSGQAVVTPLLEFAALNARVGGRVLVKAETLQRTGSFKFRGAFNAITRLAEGPTRPKAVVAFSSGNHAQGVAAAARLAGIPAIIVMPADAPANKVERTRADGAEIVSYDRRRDDREALAEAIARERGAAIVRPYDDADIIAGQGTVGLEIVRQAAAAGAIPQAVLVPCGGGGLIAGVAIAVRHALPAVAVYSVEPEGFDDTARSLAAGRRLTNAPDAGSICDALMAPQPGALTFAINARLLAGGYAVSDAEVMAAMAFAFREMKLVIEPGGAVALAALLAGRHDGRDASTVIVLSGGNVDAATFCATVSA
jgi:threonine dehydratase